MSADPLSTAHLDALLRTARVAHASDLILSAGAPPAVRVAGRLHLLDEAPLTPAGCESLLHELLTTAQMAELDRTRELDFALARQGHRCRGNAYYKMGALALALRLLPESIPKPEQLALPARLLELVDRPQGLILVTGTSNQGKTTTQAALVDYLNRRTARHIITIEDPIEFVHSNQKSLVDQREIGTDTLSFAEALRHALRQSPDVILVGEMRDAETIQTVLHAAETGQLVISTLHTNDACQAIERILDMFGDRQLRQVRNQLSLALLAVVAQRLVPRRDHHGQALAVELLINNQAVGHLIREGKTAQLYSTIEVSQGDGMRTMNQSLDELVRRGVVDQQVAARYVSLHESRSELQAAVH